MFTRISRLTTVLCLFAALRASAAVLYVSINSTNPVSPFSSWATAATNIQDAVDASSSGDLISVTNGIYQNGARLVSGDSTSNRVAVTKAVTIQSINGPAVTIIQGHQAPPATTGPSAIRCVYLTNNASLIGFTLTNGATQTGGAGGGVECQSTSAIVSNCAMVGNIAINGGGAASGTLFNCVLSNNIAQSAGGGGYNGTYNNCLFTGNTASTGGAVAPYLYGAAALNNCTVWDNSASSQGGGLASVGAAAPSLLTATNCIIFGNSAPAGPNYYYLFPAELVFNYCCTAPVPPGNVGTNCFNGDPLFLNAPGGDFHLQSNSPCINAGSSNLIGATDLDGNPRLVGAYLDLGAYEYQLPAPVPLVPIIQAAYTGVIPGIVVRFTGGIAGHPTSSEWDFGDGTVISNQLPNVSHSWTAQGDYLVALRAGDGNHSNGADAVVTIHVLLNPVHYVSQSSTNPVPPYFGWATAATNIQDAVDAAYVGGTVMVSNGIYSAGGRAVEGGPMNRLVLTNPVTVASVNGPVFTEIQGYQVPGTITGSNAVRCAYLTNNTTLAGFTLANGASGINLQGPAGGLGGGVMCESSGAIVSNCIITANTAQFEGGGVYSGTLINCVLSSNVSQNVGGGSANGILENCLLTGNTAGTGGGAFSSTLIDCTVTGNTAAQGGGVFGGLLNNCIAYYNNSENGSNYIPDGFGRLTVNSSCTSPLPPASATSR